MGPEALESTLADPLDFQKFINRLEAAMCLSKVHDGFSCGLPDSLDQDQVPNLDPVDVERKAQNQSIGRAHLLRKNLTASLRQDNSVAPFGFRTPTR